MCAVSMVMDHFGKWPNPPWNDYPTPLPTPYYPSPVPPPTDWNKYKDLFDRIKKQIPDKAPETLDLSDLLNLIEALRQAREYDVVNKEPDCVEPDKASVFDRLIQNCADKIDAAINENRAEDALALADVLDKLTKMKAEVSAQS